MAVSTHQIYSASTNFSVARYSRFRYQRYLLVLGTVVLVTVCLGLLLGSFPEDQVLIGAVFTSAILVLVLIARPVWAVYLLVAGAAIIESFRLHYPDSLTDEIPFFRSFSSLTDAAPLPITPVEVLMIAALSVVMLRRMARRETPLETGPLFWATAFFTLTVLFGFIHGVSTGGDFLIALWEIRAQTYLFPVYLLVFNLIRTEGQIKLVFWIFLIGVAFKGILGSWRFLVTLGGDLGNVSLLSTHNSLLSHEESLFFAMFIVFIVALILLRGDKGQLKFALLMSPLVLLAFLANQRRAGTLALILGIIVLALLVYILVQHRRKLLAWCALLAVVVLPLYVLALGGSDSLIAEPASSIASVYQPNSRDESSNDYRIIETTNIQHNIKLAPILGRGYGKPIIWYIPLPDLSSIFSLWEFIPHNTLLWLWMRTGFLGFVAFWFLIGRFFFEGLQIAKRQKDSYLQGIALMSIVFTLAWLTIGALDQGMVDFRSTTIVGVFMGLVARMSVQQMGQATKDARLASD